MNEFSLWSGNPDKITLTYAQYIAGVNPPGLLFRAENWGWGFALVCFTTQTMVTIGFVVMILTILLRRDLSGVYLGTCPGCGTTMKIYKHRDTKRCSQCHQLVKRKDNIFFTET